MPRYFFDVEDGHRLFDSPGFVCDDDISAIIRATVLAVGISLDQPEDDPERHIAIINDQGHRRGARVFQAFIRKPSQIVEPLCLRNQPPLVNFVSNRVSVAGSGGALMPYDRSVNPMV